MSDENKFFRFVWRANGLILLVMLVAIVAAVAYRAARDARGYAVSEAHLVQVVKTFEKQRAEDAGYGLVPLNLAFLQGANRTERLYALQKELPRSRPSRPRWDATDDVWAINILTIDDKAGTSRWLFADRNHTIISETMLITFDTPDTAKGDEKGANGPHVGGLAMVVIDADTNKDGKIDDKDADALYFYRCDGKAPVKVLDADRIVEVPYTFGTTSYEVFYQKGGKTFAASYSARDLSLKSQVAIADSPALKRAGGRDRRIGFVGFDR
jgi:hypothetical protein